MKKIVYALVLAMLLPLFSANAEKLSVPAQMNNNTFKNFKVTKEMLLTPRMDIMSEKYSNTLQADEYYTKLQYFTPTGSWIGFRSVANPIAFDPISNILIYTTYGTGTKGADLYSTINLYWTKDMGANWARDTIGEFTNEIVVNPSIVISNDDNAQTIKDLNIITYSRYATYDNAKNPFTGAYFQIRKGADYQPWPSFGPESGENSAFYLWGDGNLIHYKNDNTNFVTAVSVLGQNEAYPNAQFGTYGHATIDIDNWNNTFSIPNEWSSSNFKPGPDFTHTYNSGMLVDADNFGNIYGAVFNFCLNNDNDTIRTPAVSKSTDGGNTWSSLNLCPSKVIRDFMKANDLYDRWPDKMGRPFDAPVGSLVNWAWSAYGRNAFLATGNNEYSFITSMSGPVLVNDTLHYTQRIVEVKYKDNLWGITTIAEMQNPYIPLNVFEITAKDGTRLYDTLMASDDMYEISAAKTADGNDIICTWISNAKYVKIIPTVTLPSPIGPIDSLNTTDIFGAVRPITGSSWTAVQFTNDDYYNKFTRLPRVVPNRNNVPMLGHQSVYNSTDTEWNAYPAQFQNMNFYTYQRFYTMNFDFSNPEKLWPNTAVNNQPAITFTLNAPVPNPSNGLTELTFNMNEGAFTTLAVFNAMGVKVAELQNGYTSEGVHGLNVNTESYVSGVYYIVLTAGSNSATTLLNVVR